MKQIWSALADATRREIIDLLKERDMTAGEIVAKFDLTNASISYHLAILKDAGLVTTTKQAQTITYSLNMTVFQQFIGSLAKWFSKGDKDEK